MIFKHKILLLLVLSFFSCEPKSNNKNQAVDIKSESNKDEAFAYDDYVAESARNVQTFSINSNEHSVIKGKERTIVTFPFGCFGITEGILKVELIECFSIQSMLFNKLSTNTIDGKLLESEGMIYLNVIGPNGDTLNNVVDAKIKVQMPTNKKKDDIQVFQGIDSNGISWELSEERLLEEQKVSIPMDSEKPRIEEIYPYNDSSSNSMKIKDEEKVIIGEQIKNKNLVNYVFQISKMGWINCDRFLEGETQNLMVNVGKGMENVSLYLVLDNYNSNLMPRNPTAVNGQFEFRNVPISEPFTLVVLATKGKMIYFGMENHKGVTQITTAISSPDLKLITRQELTDTLLEKFGKDIWSRPNA